MENAKPIRRSHTRNEISHRSLSAFRDVPRRPVRHSLGDGGSIAKAGPRSAFNTKLPNKPIPHCHNRRHLPGATPYAPISVVPDGAKSYGGGRTPIPRSEFRLPRYN